MTGPTVAGLGASVAEVMLPSVDRVSLRLVRRAVPVPCRARRCRLISGPEESSVGHSD